MPRRFSASALVRVGAAALTSRLTPRTRLGARSSSSSTSATCAALGVELLGRFLGLLLGLLPRSDDGLLPRPCGARRPRAPCASRVFLIAAAARFFFLALALFGLAHARIGEGAVARFLLFLASACAARRPSAAGSASARARLVGCGAHARLRLELLAWPLRPDARPPCRRGRRDACGASPRPRSWCGHGRNSA